jgi:GalNAc5-diNAcBac-PP-undecaprenol beta-1,3-glucosyltransferase
MSPRVDIVIPTHDHALLLPLAVASAQEQTVGGVRVVVLGDGVGDDTRDVMASMLRDDPELVFVDRPKAGRTGERHRAELLATTDAEHVTYLGDDDLLFPDHVERMIALLERADVAMPQSTHWHPDGEVDTSPWSLEDEPGRSMALDGVSLFSLTGLAHTMAAYRRLPFGWRDTPPGFYTDQYMLLQFLAEDWCRFAVDDTATTVHLADSLRREMTPLERYAELRGVDEWMRRRDGWNEFRGRAQRQLRRQAAEHIVALGGAHDRLAALAQQLEELEAARAESQAALDAQVQRIAGLDEALDAEVQRSTGLDEALDAERLRSAELSAALDAERVRADALDEAVRAQSNELAAVMATRTMRLRALLVRPRAVRALLRWRRAG